MQIDFKILEEMAKEVLHDYFNDHKFAYLHALREVVIDHVLDADKLADEAIDEIITEALNRMIIDRWIEIQHNQGRFTIKKTDI
jgi:hypothetical protein